MRSRFTCSKPAARAARAIARLLPAVWVRSSTRSTCVAVLCMPNEMRVKPDARRAASAASSTLSGFASVVISASGASANSSRIDASTSPSALAPMRVGVPPPKNTVDTSRGPSFCAATRTSLASTSWNVARETESPSSVAV
ncbi:unannotated protein [freshwater metagenome]|uniref:Unannotated protein n=1 Tax=freshwater metagenome TaxID=449393 RepID=A0A6J6T7M3_9ZZZZ